MSLLSRAAAVALAASVFCSFAGCSLVLQGETQQCSVDRDCAQLGFATATCSAGVCVPSSAADAGPDAPLDPKWGCVGNVKWATPNTAVPVGVPSRYVKFVGETPLANVKAKACLNFDIACASPVAEGTTDANGMVLLQLYYGFDGYAELEPDETYPDLFPSIHPFLPPPEKDIPIPADPTELEPVHLVFKNEVNMIAAVLQTKENTAAGHILGLAIDCEGKTTAGVSLKIDTVGTDTLAYYMNQGLPSKTLGATSTTGEAGFVNVPPGMITVTATSEDVGKVSVVTVPVRAGHISYVPIAPSP